MLNLIPQFVIAEYEMNRLSGEFDAASLFMDIDDFTELTESLMQFDKSGAESLTMVLNHRLSFPVQIVYEYGGFITHFVGDGFVALFPGEAGISGAVQSAALIQKYIRENGIISTPDGKYNPTVKIGLGWGDVTWNLIEQGDHLTYSFRGSAITTGAEAEKEAGHDEIKNARQLDMRLVSAVPDTHSRLSFSDPTPSPELLARFGLSAIHPQMNAEFRSVATVFITLGRLPPPIDQLKVFVSQILNLVTDYGGYFNKLEFADKGDVILVVFGAPISQENNLKHAADFLLEVQAMQTPIKWQAGLTEGRVYAGLVGGAERNEYTVIGEVVNLASRLMSSAKSREIWTQQHVGDVLGKEGYIFNFIGDQKIADDLTMPVARLTGKGSTGLIHGEYKLAIVERTAELDLLLNAVVPIFDGHFGGLIYIHGEPGMGKSRLVYELHHRVTEQAPVLWLNGKTSNIPSSFSPFRMLLKDYFLQFENKPDSIAFHSKLDELAAFLQARGQFELYHRLEDERPYLGTFIDLQSEVYEQSKVDSRFDNRIAAFKTLIEAESQRQPVIVYVEDAHRLDGDSLELLSRLVRGVALYPFVVIFTSRYSQDGSWFNLGTDNDVPVNNVFLTALSQSGISQLAHTMLGGFVTDDTAAFLGQNSKGNPWFVQSLVRDWQERGVLDPLPNWRLKSIEMRSVPKNLVGLMTARLDRLDGAVKMIVQQAAVLGDEFSLDVLKKM